MNVWIQKHDFTNNEKEGIECEEALRAFEAFDWNTEIQKEAAAFKENKECCPPGMGLVSEDKRILHVMPGNDSLRIHYESSVKKKILGLFEINSPKTTVVSEFPEAKLKEAFRLHYDGENEQLIGLLSEYGTKEN